jgi:hypothetical protein
MSAKSSSSTITSTEVRDLLRTAAKKLSAREEKALRMRSGAGLAREQALPRRGQENPEAQAELMALELELKQKLLARGAPKAKTAAAAPVRTREKDKIIRALRRLK